MTRSDGVIKDVDVLIFLWLILEVLAQLIHNNVGNYKNVSVVYWVDFEIVLIQMVNYGHLLSDVIDL